MEAWGLRSQRGPRAERLVRGVRGRSPPEAETLLAFGHSMDTANLLFSKLSKLKKLDFAVVFARKEV